MSRAGTAATSVLDARVFILDENPIMRGGLSTIFSRNGLYICGQSGNTIKAKQEILEEEPDLVALDILFHFTPSLETIKHLHAHNSKIKILVLSELEERIYAERVIRAGASGYIMKTESAEHVIEAITDVLQGGIYLSLDLKAEFAKRFVNGETLTSNSLVDRLSQREFEVYSFLGQGRSPRDIAEELHLSVKTIQAYCTRIKDKLAFSNSRELLQNAIHWHMHVSKEPDSSGTQLH